MNRSTSGLLLSKAVNGFLQFKAAEGLSPATLTSYETHLKLWLEHLGDVPVGKITAREVQEHIAWLRTEYEPRRITGSKRPLSPKTIRNVYITLSAFFTWAAKELNLPSPMKAVPAPRFEEPPVEPFTKEEVEALLKVCEHMKTADTTYRRRFTMRRATGKRDQAIVLTLLDTGLRASELCALKIGDADPKTGKVQVKHGRVGGAKGGQGPNRFPGQVGTARRVALSRRTRGW